MCGLPHPMLTEPEKTGCEKKHSPPHSLPLVVIKIENVVVKPRPEKSQLRQPNWQT
jgi:hypothetical protein